MRRLLVFTDLDGTLLDASTYSFDQALPALGELGRRGIPLILCSSKTRSEIESWRLRLGNAHPFVFENGGGIFIPRGTFPDAWILSIEGAHAEENGFAIALGASYARLREGLGHLRAMGWPVRGFGDMTEAEIAALTGLSVQEAGMAKARDHDEPFVVDAAPIDTAALNESVAHIGLRLTQGRFYHLLGASDKGKAVEILMRLYGADGGKRLSAALGDSPNDIEMLVRVDRPIVVEKPGGGWDLRIEMPGLIRGRGIGPIGWNRTVLDLLNQSLEEG